MRLRIYRNRILILPDDSFQNDERDEAYIEEVLGLVNDGDTAVCKRVNAMSLSCLAYIEISKKEK